MALLNDLVGGVTLEVLDDFSGIDDTLVQGETVTLKGQQALTYVRSRGGLEDSTNLHRMERQRQYLSALQGQLSSKAQSDDGFTLEALLQLNEYPCLRLHGGAALRPRGQSGQLSSKRHPHHPRSARL